MDGTSVAGIDGYAKPLGVITRTSTALTLNGLVKVSPRKFKKLKKSKDIDMITKELKEEEDFFMYPVVITDGVNNLLIDEEE